MIDDEEYITYILLKYTTVHDFLELVRSFDPHKNRDDLNKLKLIAKHAPWLHVRIFADIRLSIHLGKKVKIKYV